MPWLLTWVTFRYVWTLRQVCSKVLDITWLDRGLMWFIYVHIHTYTHRGLYQKVKKFVNLANTIKESSQPIETGFCIAGTCTSQLSIVSVDETVIVHSCTLHFPIAPSLNDVPWWYFFWTEVVKPADIHRRMLTKYSRVNCMNQRKVYICVHL
jgi:hypothetical protein